MLYFAPKLILSSENISFHTAMASLVFAFMSFYICLQRSDCMLTRQISTSHQKVMMWILVVSFTSASPVGRCPCLVTIVPFS